MNNVPRRSEYSLTDDERDNLRKQNGQYIENFLKRGRGRTEKQANVTLLSNLYYDIGMQDFMIYRDINSDMPKEKLRELIKGYLKIRANDSARLQVLIDDMKANGFDFETITNPQISDVFEYNSSSSAFSNMLYHGTTAELEPDQIGNPDENGMYHIKDGFSWWTPNYNIADGRASKLTPDEERRGISGGNVFSRGIEDGTLCAIIPETYNGAFAMWQDEFIKLNQKGVRYVFPKEIERAEVLDISNFADFVQKRDESVVKAMKEFGFRLPEKAESLNDYFMELENVHQIDEKEATESNIGKNQTIEKKINGTKYTMTIVNDRTSLSYVIVYTDRIKSDSEMIVETINLSGNKNVMQEIKNTAGRLFTISDKAPIVIPLIPQSTPECDVQQLAKECFTNENGSGQRIDLQVLDCIQDAKKFIEETANTKVKDKVFLNGYSASGVFAQRFALIHPEIIHRCCIGGAAGSIPIPNEELGYPLGTEDYKEIFGKEFDETEYKKIDFAYYVGQGEAHEAGNWDTNGNAIRRDKDGRRIDKTQIPAPMHDMSYKGDTTPAEIGVKQREIYGEDLNSRFINSLRYYKDNDYNIKAKIYRGIGHKGIFDSRMNPFAGVVMSDIRNFYENGEGFLPDNTSINRIDMREQTRREKRNEHSNETNISDYE